MKRLVALAIVTGLLGALSALAASHGALVDTRRQAMKDMAAAAKIINGMFEGKRAYDRQAFAGAARTIGAHSGSALTGSFLEGTLGPPSQALASIATDPDEFASLAGRLHSYAAALSEKAEERLTPAMRMGAEDGAGAGSLLGSRARVADLKATPAEHVFHLMLQTCTACHARFRQRQ